MLERCYTSPVTLRRLAEGAAGPFLDGFARELFGEGYSADGCGRHVFTAAHLGEWTTPRHVALADLDEAILRRFVQHLARCRCRGGRRAWDARAPFQAHRFLRYLRETGVVASRAPGPQRSALVVELVAWLRDQRRLAETTVARIVRVVQALLDTVGDEPERWDAAGVRAFVLGYVPQHARASAGLVTMGVRCVLRYLSARGRCSPALIDAVPTVPTWRMVRLPRYLSNDAVEQVIAACDQSEGTALRNRALLLLLARLGLRSHEVVGLRLGDIDWSDGRLQIRGKGGRAARLPLPQDAGDALLRYVDAARPPGAATDAVFLTSRAPRKPLGTAGLRDVVARAITRAGVQTPSHGTHLLRHSLATRLLREGATLDTIGALLRHRDVDTTALYAKVDVALLQQVAQPWPGEVSSC